MTRDPRSLLPPANEKAESLPLGTRFFDLAENYVYLAVATLLLLGAVATIVGHALYSAIQQTRSGVGLLILIFSLLNDLLLVLIITEFLRTVVGDQLLCLGEWSVDHGPLFARELDPRPLRTCLQPFGREQHARHACPGHACEQPVGDLPHLPTNTNKPTRD